MYFPRSLPGRAYRLGGRPVPPDGLVYRNFEKTAADAVTSFQRVNGNFVGISVSKTKCCFLFYTNDKILEEKLIYVVHGKETDALGKEDFFEYEFQKGDSTYNFLLGNVIELPENVEKVVYVTRFSNSPGSATRIECELDAEGKVIHKTIRQVDARVEFPQIEQLSEDK